MELEICYMPALEMAKAIKSKRISPVEIMEAVLNRIEKINPRVNAYCTLVAEEALSQARRAESMVMKGEELGPLHGVPVSIKDLIFTRGIRTTGGSRVYANFVPEKDDIAVERLKAAGAIILGKTNTPEFGWTAITDNPLFGPTRNPWNPALTAGGSSGGAAAAVALGMGPIALGNDGGGSIRIPSSFCGVFGYKPSFGRVPEYAGFPRWANLNHTGPITRTVADAALTMEIIAGRDDRDQYTLPEAKLSYLAHLDLDLKGLKVAWSRDLGYISVEPQVLKVTEAAVESLAKLVGTLDVASPEAGNPEAAFSVIATTTMVAVLQDKVAEKGDQMAPALVKYIQRNTNKSATEYVNASLKLLEYWNRVQPFFEKYDLLLTPTVAVPPFEIGSFGPRVVAGNKISPLGWLAFTYPFNITGQPAASIPCGWTNDGLPVGLQIVGRRFADLTVLRAAAAFERALPWADKKPAPG